MSADAPDRLERYRHHYADLIPGWVPATAEYQRWVTGCVHHDARILDLGCGRGGIVERLQTRGHWTGSDPDFASLREHRSPTLARCCADSEQLPFPTGTFDVIVASWVLEHLSHPKVAFGEISRVLRTGGRFIFLTPNAAHPLPWLSRKLASLRRLQRRLVSIFYHRSARDTFPVTYHANTYREIEQLALSARLRLTGLAWVTDPSYFAWDTKTFWMAVGLSALLPARRRVHLIGELTKP